MYDCTVNEQDGKQSHVPEARPQLPYKRSKNGGKLYSAVHTKKTMLEKHNLLIPQIYELNYH